MEVLSRALISCNIAAVPHLATHDECMRLMAAREGERLDRIVGHPVMAGKPTQVEVPW